jgi:hypothetical protein
MADFGVDQFGVKKLYGSDPAKTSEDWFMGNLNSDARVEIDGAISEISAGVWEGRVTSSMNPASFRINVRTTNPNAFDIGVQLPLGSNWANRKTAGYTVDARDFRNVEMTGYWKVTQWSDDDEYSFYSHGGHNTDGWPEACLGTQYKGQIQRAGNPRFAKEYHHLTGNTGYVFRTTGTKFTISARNNIWVGQKVCVYDTKDSSGKTVVKCEVWCDETGDADASKQNWRLMQELVDDGAWGEPSQTGYISNCHAVAQQQFLWGGPSATFRIDNVIVQTKKFSIRNILAVGGATTTCPSGQHVDPVSGQCVADSTGPATPVTWIRFFLSGVTTNNNNPYDSLGGPISNVQISDNTFNNLFDNVDPNQMKQGSKTNRLIYVRNQGAQTVNLRAWFDTVDNYTGISLGTVGKNTTEPPMPPDTDPGSGNPGSGTILYTIFDNPPAIGLNTPGIKLYGTTLNRACGEAIYDIRSPLYNMKPNSITLYCRKVGNPVGLLSCKIRHYNAVIGLNFSNDINVATDIPAGSAWTPVTFTQLDTSDFEPNGVDQLGSGLPSEGGDDIVFEFQGGDGANYVEIPMQPTPIEGQQAVDEFPDYLDPAYDGEKLHDALGRIEDICMTVKISTGVCFDVVTPPPGGGGGVSNFTKPTTFETGIVMPSLSPGDYCGLWLQRLIPADTTIRNPDVSIDLIVGTDVS